MLLRPTGLLHEFSSHSARRLMQNRRTFQIYASQPVGMHTSGPAK